MNNDINILQKVNIKLQKGDVDVSAMKVLEDDVLRRFATLNGLEATARPKLNVSAEVGKITGLEGHKKIAAQFKKDLRELERETSQSMQLRVDNFINSEGFTKQSKEVQSGLRALQTAYTQLTEIQSKFKPDASVTKLYEKIAQGSASYHKITDTNLRASLDAHHKYFQEVQQLENKVISSFSNMGRKTTPSDLANKLKEVNRQLADLESTNSKKSSSWKQEAKLSSEEIADIKETVRQKNEIIKEENKKAKAEAVAKHRAKLKEGDKYVPGSVTYEKKPTIQVTDWINFYKEQKRDSNPFKFAQETYKKLLETKKSLQTQIAGYSDTFGSQIGTQLAVQAAKSAEVISDFSKATGQAEGRRLKEGSVNRKSIADANAVEAKRREAVLKRSKERKGDWQSNRISGVDAHNKDLNQEFKRSLDPNTQRLKLGESLVNSGHSYNSMDRATEIPFVKAFHKAGIDAALTAQNLATNPADYAKANKDLHEHTKGYERATRAAKEYRTEVGKIGHAFETLTRYGVVANVLYSTASAISAVIKSVIDLEDEMKNIQAITSSSDTQMAVIGQSIKDTATTTAFSIKEIAGAVKTVAQAGVEMKDIPKTVQAIADVATATGSQLQTAADIITTVKEVWDNIDVSTIGDRVAQAANISKLAVEDLKTILSLNASAAKSANVSLEQSLSLDALLRNSGVKASTIATGSTQMYRELFSPDKKFSDFLSKQYARAGETVSADEASKRFSDYRLSDNPLVEAISELKRIGVGDHKSITELERAMDSRALNVFKPLLNSDQSLQGLEAQMRAGATAAEGAATASHTVKKAFENLGDQVEVLADAMGEPLLEPIRNIVEFINNKIVKPATEGVEDAKLAREHDERRTKRLRNEAHKAIANGDELGAVAPYLQSFLDDRQNIGARASDVSLKSLLAQQAKKQKELEKEYEQYKAFTDSPDSLKTLFEGKKTAFNSFNSNLEETFGKSAEPNQIEGIIKLLSEASTKKQGQRQQIVDQIKHRLGVTKDPNVEDISRIANEANSIDETLKAIVKSYKTTFNSLVETKEVFGKLNPAQDKLLAKLLEIKKNPEFDKAIWGSGSLSMTDSMGLITQINDALSPAVSELVQKKVEQEALFIAQQAESAIRNPSELGSMADLSVVGDNLVEKLKDGTIEDAKKMQDAILEVVNKSSELSTEQKNTLAQKVAEATLNATAGIAERIKRNAEDIAAQVKDTLEKTQNVSESDMTPRQLEHRAYLQSVNNVAEGSNEFIPEATKKVGIDEEWARVAQARESSNGKALYGSSNGAGTQALGAFQQKPIAIVQAAIDAKKYGVEFDTAQAISYKSEYGGTKGKVVQGPGYDALNKRDAAYGMSVQFAAARDKYAKKGGEYPLKDGVDAQLAYWSDAGYETWVKSGRKVSAFDPSTPFGVEGIGIVKNYDKHLALSKGLVDKKGNPNQDVLKANKVVQTAAAKEDENKYKTFELANEDLVKQFQSDMEDIRIRKTQARDNQSELQKILAEEQKLKRTYGNSALDHTNNAFTQGKDQTKSSFEKQRASERKRWQQFLASESVSYAGELKSSQDRISTKTFNTNEPEFVKNEDAIRNLRTELDDPKMRLAVNDKDRVGKLEEIKRKIAENAAMQVKHLEGQYVSKINAGAEWTPDEVTVKAKESAIKKVTDAAAEATRQIDKQIKEGTANALLKSLQDDVKKYDQALNEVNLEKDKAIERGDEKEVKRLIAEGKSIWANRLAARKRAIESDPNTSDQASALAELEYENKQHKEATKTAAEIISTRENRFKDQTSDPVEGFARKGQQEALGHTQYLVDQKLDSARKTIAYSERLVAAQKDLATATDANDIKKFTDEVNAATLELSKLKVESQDLNATLASELAQISTDNIVAEINNLQGSLKNLDKNISQRVVQFVDQASSGIAESAVTATKSLLGFNTATKEVTDSLVNLLEKQGNAALVKTDRVELAQKIQSVRLNEADPVRQEALIKQAMDAQAQAEAIAQQQVNEAQRQADKAAYDNSMAGKIGNAATDMVGGIAQDVIKAQVMDLFSGADGSAEKPFTVHVDNLPDTLGGVSTVNPTSSTGILGSLGRAWDSASTGISNWWNDTPSGTYGVLQSDQNSAAQGGNALPDKVGTATESGITTGMNKSLDKQESIFSGFTDSMGGKFDTFLSGFSAIAMMSSAAKAKQTTLDKVQQWLGVAQAGVGLLSAGTGFIGKLGTSSVTSGIQSAGYGAFRANGGYITGPGTTTSDSIPTMLSNGEYVLKASAVRHIGKETLDHWNEIAKSPIRRATGGVVGTLSAAQNTKPQILQPPVPQKSPDTNVRVVLVDDQRRVGDFINSPEGEQSMLQFVKKNSMSIRQMVR